MTLFIVSHVLFQSFLCCATLCYSETGFLTTIAIDLHPWNQQFLTPTCLEQNAQAIRRVGSPPPNCFGFVDGTVKLISRRCENQRLLYDGQKRVHTLKFQSLVIPNAIIANLFGPSEDVVIMQAW